MFLILCAQDIHRISFGLFEKRGGKKILMKEAMVDVAPEQYLQALDDFLKEWQSSREHSLEGVIVVTGPGSFTASRVSTTIANGLAFTKSLPVIGVENPEFLDLKTMVSMLDDNALRADFAVATYQSPPHITKPTV